MSFIATLNEWPEDRVRALIDGATANSVESALARDERTMADFATLLSPHALPHLEAMAQEAQRLTRWHFGRTVGLYVPIYLSNVCGADCTYCGYAVRSENTERRVTLTDDQIHQRGLAKPIRAGHSHDRARGHVEIEVVE